MLDSRLRSWIDPPLNRAGRELAGLGITPNAVTAAGFLVGVAGAVAIALQAYTLGLWLILGNRLADGLDGAVARHTEPTDLGGYLDIVLDFLFYSGIVFAFAVADPERGLMAAFLIYSFVGTGCSFLAYAIVAAKRGITTEARGRKAFYHLGGLTEGTETIVVLVLLCLWPAGFGWIAGIFGLLCWLTTAGRIGQAVRVFGDRDRL